MTRAVRTMAVSGHRIHSWMIIQSVAVCPKIIYYRQESSILVLVLKVYRDHAIRSTTDAVE